MDMDTMYMDFYIYDGPVVWLYIYIKSDHWASAPRVVTWVKMSSIFYR